MSSGHGISGGVGRCYPFFAEFKECLVSLIGSGEAGCVKQSTKNVFLFLPKQPPLINILMMMHIMCSTLIIIS